MSESTSEGACRADEIKAIAIDIGGSHATCALVHGSRVLAKKSICVEDARSLKRLLPGLAEAAGWLFERCGLRTCDCAGVAVSFPGIVEPWTGQIFSTPKGKYDDASTMDFVSWSEEQFQLPLRIENDARMALLGEHHCGAAQGCGDAVLITLGTGVGGAVLMAGRLLRGKHFQAGLAGHFPVAFEGRACICGNRGCVEAETSTWALPAICRTWPGFGESALAREALLDFAALFRLSRAGDPTAIAIRDRCLRVWAAGAVGMIHAFDPEVVVFGGAVMQSGDQILPFVERYIHARAWTSWGKVRVCKTELGTDAGLLGAVPLLSDHRGAIVATRRERC